MKPARRRVLVLTGAGISAESGIPTFRGKDGYWRNRDPRTLATEAAFEQDPELVWEWYRERRRLIRRSEPNAAHVAVIRLAALATDFLLVTQNVDNLHARAEYEGQRLAVEQMVQIHGDIFSTRCRSCDFAMKEEASDLAGVPACPQCRSSMRPGVVWFGEWLNPREVQRVEKFLSNGPCDLAVVIGTTATFDYVINWACAAKGSNGRLVEINPERTALSQFATEVIQEPAARSLPQLVAELTRTSARSA
jgi:NAD-dependent deacetylase